MQLLRIPTIAILAPLLGLGWAADASGCGKQPASTVNVTTRFNVTSGGLSRSYYVHVPGGYDMNKEYPVVLAFHGSGETAQEMELDTRLSDPKWSPNSIMVYPQGVNSTWAGASYANSTIPEDLQFVNDLLSDMAPKYCIDTNRLYAAGFSNGGGFVNILACAGNSAGAKFAAFVTASGAYYQEELWNSTLACTPAKLPTPIALIAGKNDTVVYYNGGNGEGGIFPAVPSVVDKWVDRNHCTSLATTASDNNTVHVSSWTCAGVDGSLVFYEEDDMGHVWASQTQTFSQLVMGEGPTKLEANQIIMDFFSKFTLDKEQAAETTSAYTAPSSVLLPYTQASGSSPVPTASASVTGSGMPVTTTTSGASPSETASKAGAAGVTAVAGLFGGLLPLGAAIALL